MLTQYGNYYHLGSATRYAFPICYSHHILTVCPEARITFEVLLLRGMMFLGRKSFPASIDKSFTARIDWGQVCREPGDLPSV